KLQLNGWIGVKYTANYESARGLLGAAGARYKENIMEYRRLGQTGVKIAPLAIGTLNFGYATAADEAERILGRALDVGINLIDSANSYNNGDSERMLGELIGRNSWRDRIVLATKAFFPVGDGPNDR